MTTTKSPPALNTTVFGPWRSRYAVTEQTLAVNLAQSVFVETGECDLDAVRAIDAAVEIFEDESIIHDGSIRGFWAWVWSGLDRGTQRDVAKRAEALLVAHRAAAFGSKHDLFEQFDGQK